MGGLCRGVWLTVPSSGRPLHRAASDTLDLFARDERAAPQFLLRFCFCLCGTEPLEAAVQLTHKHTPTDRGWGGGPAAIRRQSRPVLGRQIPVGTLEIVSEEFLFTFFTESQGQEHLLDVFLFIQVTT